MTLLVLCASLKTYAQSAPGIIAGNILDEKKNAVSNATVELIGFADSIRKRSVATDKNGEFSFYDIPFGRYRIKITYVGFTTMTLDSIHVRAERYDFNMNDLILKQAKGDELAEVVVYAEKPLIQTKDGNITFNAAESPLAAGSNASELLKNVPLVTTDPDGKILLKGKEPKILVDDKPVQLNQQQLQDLLESMSGSMIEKIEVLTTPPPQYANEQGGVINIVTRKGKVGIGGRISVSAGTRGQENANAFISYRKKGLSISLNMGAGFNTFQGHGYSKRENIYTDSTNHFNTENSYRNRNSRPNARLSIDYDFDSRNSLNAVLQYNQNIFHNRNQVEYTNINRYGDTYKISDRFIRSEGQNASPNISLTYLHKGKQAGETIRFIATSNYSYNQNDRYFFQEFLNSDRTKTGTDSTQQQLNDTWNHGYSVRVDYDRMLPNKKTYISTGVAYNAAISHVLVNASYLRKADLAMVKSDALSNDFHFRQGISNVRFSIKQVFSEGFSAVTGLTAENAEIRFNLHETKERVFNNYWSWLPFANLNRTWKNKLNLSVAYRRSIRRPGINELNPSIDNGDPYNIRFGNPYLLPSLAHNFDLVIGKTRTKLFLNFGVGYNIVEDIYSQLRTLLPEGKTQITWRNISNRTEYEMSTWSGYTISKKLRVNLSATYTYNQYSAHDRTANKYRNGGSFGSNLNATFTPMDVWNFTGSFTFNRFANPQGSVRSNLSMNVGIQKKWLDRKLITTLNVIDPFMQQENKSFTYAPNFNLESYSTTQTRNIRLTLAYVFNNAKKNNKALNKAIDKVR
ncbi:MAG TPA: outer membrane beta-barrel protein [Chitinophagaceae bacterium]|nr:outer membrane beta-barrel protein [Chitinophagaceae bacterium]